MFSPRYLVWFGVKFTPGGHSTFFGLLNTAVHIVMYTYYMFAAMGPQYQKYLWWKKYLTGLQMVSDESIYNYLQIADQLVFFSCFRFNSFSSLFMPSSFLGDQIAIIPELSCGGLECTLLCFSTCSENSITNHMTERG